MAAVDLPYEVLKLIVIFVTNSDDDLGPPAALIAFCLALRSIHNTVLGAPTRGLPANDEDHLFHVAFLPALLSAGELLSLPIPPISPCSCHARTAAQRHLYSYDEDIPVEQLVQRLCVLKQSYTQYGGMHSFQYLLIEIAHVSSLRPATIWHIIAVCRLRRTL
jgi:hypothetical protein